MARFRLLHGSYSRLPTPVPVLNAIGQANGYKMTPARVFKAGDVIESDEDLTRLNGPSSQVGLKVSLPSAKFERLP